MKKTDPSIIAQKYAKALFELALRENQIDSILSDLVVITQVLKKQSLHGALNTPDGSHVWSLVIEAAGEKFQPIVKHFFELLREMDRAFLIQDIYSQFVKICDAHFDVARGTLITAINIDSEQIESMQAIVTAKIGKKVIFEHKNDPAILGGVIAEVGGWTFDDSLKTHLNKINQRLAN